MDGLHGISIFEKYRFIEPDNFWQKPDKFYTDFSIFSIFCAIAVIVMMNGL